MTSLPHVFRLRQHFDTSAVVDVGEAVEAELKRLDLGRSVLPGQSVAVTVGSRGIAELPRIVSAIVGHLRALGAEPFVVPAMGSHGGGTAEGQRQVLAGYGVTEPSVGCPIRSSMETVVLGRTDEGFDVHFDRLAHEADHVLVFNRIKPHTRFVGPVESGLLKMMLIGLGKRVGSEIYHRAILDHAFPRILEVVAGHIFGRCSILAGLAVVENAHDRPAHVEAVRPEDFLHREPELLELARRRMPRLPFDRADLLLVDRIGKNISGSGMDTNVVGRKFNNHQATGDERPKIRSIGVRRLSTESHGNAMGIGLAELCRSDLLATCDWDATLANALAAGHLEMITRPVDCPTDREMIDLGLRCAGLVRPVDARLLWIVDTLSLVELECSVAYLPEARQRDDLEIVSPPRPLPLDDHGELPESLSRS